MAGDHPPLGFDTVNGRFFPVQASVAPRYGRGAMLGLAVGAALGDLPPGQAPPESALPVTAEAPFVLHLAAELSESLMLRGRLVTADLAERLGAFVADPRLDAATRTALGLIGHGVPVAAVGQRMWVAGGRRPGDERALWAAVPIGLFYAGLDDHRLPSALDVTAWSHADPRCRLAAAGVAEAIAAGTRDGATADAMCVAAMDAIDAGAQRLIDDAPAAEGDAIEAAHGAVRAALNDAFEDDDAGRPSAAELGSAGALDAALRAIFHHLYRESPWPALAAALAGTGHVAAVAGALLGAARGEDALPEAWRDAVTPAEGPEGDTVMSQLLALVAG